MSFLKYAQGTFAAALICFFSISAQAGGDDKKTDDFELDNSTTTTAVAAVLATKKTLTVKNMFFSIILTDCPIRDGDCTVTIVVDSKAAPHIDSDGTFTGATIDVFESAINDPKGTGGVMQPLQPQGSFTPRAVDVGVYEFGPGELQQYPKGGLFVFQQSVMVAPNRIECSGPMPVNN